MPILRKTVGWTGSEREGFEGTLGWLGVFTKRESYLGVIMDSKELVKFEKLLDTIIIVLILGLVLFLCI